MTQSTYDVSFCGALVGGADLSQVKNNVAKLFKTDIQKIEVMFSGKRVVIKRDLDQQTALKYQAAMRNAGAICDVTEKQPQPENQESSQYSAENPPPIPAPAVNEEPKNTSRQIRETSTGGVSTSATPLIVSTGGMDSVTIAPPGETIIEHKKIVEPQIDISAISMDDSKSNLVEHKVIPEPSIDTSAINLDSSGADLVQHKKIPEPEFDISAINMDVAGVDLAEHKEIPPVEIDISDISMAPPGSPVLDK